LSGYAVITGGGVGIGRAIAQRLASDNLEIWLVDKDESQGIQAQSELRAAGYRCTYVNFDLADWNCATDVLDLVPTRRGGRLVLVNNAGARSTHGLFEQTEESWTQLIAVMMTATFRFSQEFILRAKDSGSHGAICNIGSIVSGLASDQSPAYHAAKAGVAGLTNYLAVAAGRAGVQMRVNSVEPGLIVQDRHIDAYSAESNLAWRTMCESYQPTGVVGREQDVANAVAWLCSDQASYINGATLRIDGGASVQDQFTLVKSFNMKHLD
jgi:3-oxoacyl-[acyl-carrier protein] reductase